MRTPGARAGKDALLECYSVLAPRGLHILDPEECYAVYKELGLAVAALPDGGLKVSVASGEETKTWETVGTSTR